MRNPSASAVLLASALVLGSAPTAAFDLSWTDQFGETTYTLSGPDIVNPGDLVVVTVTVTDVPYPAEWVASSWSVTDNGSSLGGGFSIWLDENGFWTSVFELTYDEIGFHDILFTAQDLGQGGGAHGWEWFELTGTIEVSDIIGAEVTTWGNVKQLYR